MHLTKHVQQNSSGVRMENHKFNEQDIKRFYSFFKHTKPTEIRVFDKIKYPKGKSIFIQTEEDFLNSTVKYIKEGVSVYIGGRDRIGQSTQDIVSTNFIFLEIDEHDIEKPETKKQVENFLKQNEIEIGMIGFSGGGYHFYIPHKTKEINNSDDLELSRKFLLSFRQALIDNNLDIDKDVFDLPRVTRVLGTYNFKRNKLSKILYFNNEIDLEKNFDNIKKLALKHEIQTVQFDNGALEKVHESTFASSYLEHEPFWKLFLTTKFPEGGINAILEKNFAIWCIQNNFPIPLEEIKSSYKKMNWSFSPLEKYLINVKEKKYWSKDNEGNLKNPEYNYSELLMWCKNNHAEHLEEMLKAIIYKPNISNTSELNLNDYLRIGKFGKYIDIDAFANCLVSIFNFKTIYNDKSETIYVYQGGVYTKEGRKIIETEAEKLFGSYCTHKAVKEIIYKIQRLTAVDRTIFDDIPANFIPLENGIYDIEKKELLEYSPAYCFTSKLPVKYNGDASCEKFLEFLNETLYEDDIPVIQELFGYSLYRKYIIKKGVIYTGETDTGKTILLNIHTKFIGQKNQCGISLQRIAGNDKFGLSSLYNKLLNAYDDLSAHDIADGGGFKIATGGGYITAEHKFGDPFQFKNFAKLLFACNKIPSMKENDDDAYYNRWLLIPFDNHVPTNRQIKNYDEIITTQTELSGILNWALTGLERLLLNGQFSYTRTKQEVKVIMNRSSSPLAAFAYDALEESKTGQTITKEEMHTAYLEWATRTSSPKLSIEQLGRQLTNYATYMTHGNEHGVRFWRNVAVKQEFLTQKILHSK